MSALPSGSVLMVDTVWSDGAKIRKNLICCIEEVQKNAKILNILYKLGIFCHFDGIYHANEQDRNCRTYSLVQKNADSSLKKEAH